MHLKIVYGLSLISLCWSLAAVAEDIPLTIHTDLKGDYFLVERGLNDGKPTLLVKRVVSETYSHFIKREFDCAARTERYLGEGESLDEVAVSQPELESLPIVEGTIPDQLYRLACPGE